MHMTEQEYEEYLIKQGKQPADKKKQPKYRNNRTKVDGILFDSKKEADYYSDLKLQLRIGTIWGFCRQPEFILLEGFAGVRPETYRADFIVFNLDGTCEIVDVKGYRTEVYKIKEKQFKIKFPRLELKIV